MTFRTRSLYLVTNIKASCIQYSLQKHAYSNILKISPKKNTENFQIKKLIFFIFLLETWIVGAC